MDYQEYRGVSGLVIAEVEKDDTTEYTAKAWQELSGVQSVSLSKNESSESHFYDNAARIVIDAEGADEVTLVVSILANKTRALIDGVEHDENSDMIINTPKQRKYFALGYIGEKTDGTREFNIFYKGKFSGGAETYNTKDDGTEATNVEYTFTAVHTTYKIYGNKTVKSIKVPEKGKVTEAAIFGTSTTRVAPLTPTAIAELK